MSRLFTSSKDAEVRGLTDQDSANPAIHQALDRKLKGRAKGGSLSFRNTQTHLVFFGHDSQGKPGAPIPIPKAVQSFTGDFTGISGSIDADQHGAQTIGTLHAVATASVNGFMSAADFTKLGNITTAGTPTNLLNCTALRVNNVKVVGAQGAAVADASGASLANTTAQLNALLARCRAHGLIDT